jgi:hypothetical protein
VNAAELPAPQLGRILIAAGLLSEEQLAQALEEQAQTGRRLGEIIVQRGFISGPALANALAEQHGGVLKTEYGFASGLGGVVARRAAAESGTSVSPLRPPDPTPMPTLRTAEPQAISLVHEEEQEPAASEELAEQPVQQETPEPLSPAEPAPEPQQTLATSEVAEPPPEQETPKFLAPVDPPPEPEQTLEPPPLLRPAEPPAPAFEEPSEPEPPPAAVSPLSPPLPPEPLAPAPPPAAPEPKPAFQEAPQPVAPEPELLAPPEPEPTPPAEAAEPIPDPVELRPAAPEPIQEAPQPVFVEPELLPPRELEPTLPAEAAEPIPEPVDLRPPAAEPAQEASRSVVPEPEPTPPAEAAEPVPEPPQAPEPELQPEPEQPAATALDDRDELIEALRARVEAQELELAKLREQLEEERTRKDVQVHVWPEEQPVPTTPGPAQTENYLLCVPTAAGYVLLDRVGGLPTVGQAVDVPEEEGRFTVTKVVRLPRNGRPCAYLQRA